MKPILLLVGLAICLACSKNNTDTAVVVLDQQTPESFGKQNNSLDVASFSRVKGRKDIVDQLFDEAVDEQPELKAIVVGMEKAERMEADSLKGYHQYISNNDAYWHSVNWYMGQISDSLLRETVTAFVDTLKSRHEQQMAPLSDSYDELALTKVKMKDMERVMKIMVTTPMMINYQRNELPQPSSMRAVEATYDSLISDMEPYSSIPVY